MVVKAIEEKGLSHCMINLLQITCGFSTSIDNYHLRDVPMKNATYTWSSFGLTQYASLTDHLLVTDICATKFGSF